MNQFQACLCIVAAAFFVACWSTDMEYLESNGLTWIQMFVIAEVCACICISMLWIIIFAYHWYFNNDINNNNFFNKQDFIALGFMRYLFSIFPSFSNESDIYKWKLMFGRGLFLSFEIECYMIALTYLESGDAMLLRTTFTSFFGVILSMLIFGEKINGWIIISFIFGVIGLSLVCQPTWLFSDNSNAHTLSIIGILFAVLSAMFRIMDKVLLKYSGSNNNNNNNNNNSNAKRSANLHWLPMMLIPYIMTSIVALIQLIIMIIMYYDDIYNKVWYMWNINENSYAITLCVIFYGIILTLTSLCFVVGYRSGQLGRLGIINNLDVPISYFLQVIILNTIDNIYVYIGATIVVCGIILLFWEQYKIAKQRMLEHELKQQQDIEHSVSQSQPEFDLISQKSEID